MASSTNAAAVSLQALDHVAVEVECDADAAVPQALGGNLGMHACREHVARMGMTEIMESHAGEGALNNAQPPLLADGVGIVWAAVRLGDDEGISVQRDT